jgi:hypothetical protein
MIAPTGAQAVAVTFIAFDVTEHYDRVYVYQCTDTACLLPQQLASLSGTPATPWNLASATGFVKVVFTAAYGGSGFNASWTSVGIAIPLLPFAFTECARSCHWLRIWNHLPQL